MQFLNYSSSFFGLFSLYKESIHNNCKHSHFLQKFFLCFLNFFQFFFCFLLKIAQHHRSPNMKASFSGSDIASWGSSLFIFNFHHSWDRMRFEPAITLLPQRVNESLSFFFWKVAADHPIALRLFFSQKMVIDLSRLFFVSSKGPIRHVISRKSHNCFFRCVIVAQINKWVLLTMVGDFIINQ